MLFWHRNSEISCNFSKDGTFLNTGSMNASTFGMGGSSSSFGMSNGGGSAPPRSGGRGPQVKIFGIPEGTDLEVLKEHFASAGMLLIC